MTDQIRQLVEPDERILARVPFGRNRFLRALGVALFGFAVQMIAPQPVYASHAPPPAPCFGYHPCQKCSGSTCISDAGCQWHTGHSHGCPSGGQCWYTCAGGLTHKCCDWHENPSDALCICQVIWGPGC